MRCAGPPRLAAVTDPSTPAPTGADQRRGLLRLGDRVQLTDPRGWGFNGTQAVVQAGFLIGASIHDVSEAPAPAARIFPATRPVVGAVSLASSAACTVPS